MLFNEGVKPVLDSYGNYIKERNETQMENKRPLGRLATGRLRDKQLSSTLTTLLRFHDTQFATHPYTLHRLFDNRIQINLR